MFKQLPDPTTESFVILVDGREVSARNGETLAAVLLRTPPFTARKTPIKETPRAPYCLMGACFDCLATVDGQTSIQTCMVAARPNMRVERPAGKVKVIA